METIKKLDDERIRVTASREDDVFVLRKDDLISELAEAQEKIIRVTRYLEEFN